MNGKAREHDSLIDEVPRRTMNERIKRIISQPSPATLRRMREAQAAKHEREKQPFVPGPHSEQQFFIPGLLLGLNDVLAAAGANFGGRKGRGGNAYNALKDQTQRTIKFHIRARKITPMKQAFFFFTYQEKTRQRDKDNIAAVVRKFVFDTLVKTGNLPNDGWKEIAGWYDNFEVVKTEPGVLVMMIDPAVQPEKIKFILHDRITKDLSQWKLVGPT